MRIPFLGNIGPNSSKSAPMGDQPRMPMEQLLGHTEAAKDPGEIQPRVGAVPFGASGRANFYGLPQYDELNPKLIGPRGLMLLDDMYWTDAHVRRLVLAAWSPIVAATWTLDPYGGDHATELDRQIAETVWWMLNQWMCPNFTEHLYEVGPALLRFGFVPFEEQWDTCEYHGKTLIGPKKLGFMLPRTIWKWWQDDYGNLTHIGQILPNKADVVIPASEVVYYRLAAEGDNWMGRSLLRHCYKHWTIKDRLERIDMVGQERKAVGMPVVYHSPDIDNKILNAVETAIANMHVSEVAYLMLPGWKMGAGGKDDPANQWLVDIVKFDSSSGDSIRQSIDYHQTAMSASFLQDFLELGHHQVGARATAEVQMDPFITAINGALLPPVVPPLNRLIDRIVKRNWANAEGSPQLKLTLHDEASLSEIATYAVPLAQQGLLHADPELEDWLRERAAMPSAGADAKAAQAAQAAGTQAAAGANAANADAAAKLAKTGEPPGAEPPNPDTPPGKQLDAAAGGPAAAGVVVQALDTGRLLMIQRTPDKHDHGEAYARWEFPGGKLDATDQSDWTGALREWHEETGAVLPNSAVRAGDITTPDSVYQAFVAWVPREADVTLGAHDKHEVADVAWRDADALANDPVVRDKVKAMLPHIHRLLAPSKKTLDAERFWQAVNERRYLLDQARDDNGDKVMAVDFDGVLHPHRPNAGAHEPVGPPIDGAVGGMQKLAKRYQVVIFTARSHLQPVRDWLRDNGLGDFADSVTNIKPPAAGYIDDRAIHFKGWDKLPSQLEKRELDAPPPEGEPTAKWWEQLLSQDRLREALDGARAHIELAAKSATLNAARHLAHQAANGADVSNSDPPAELVDALTRHYTDLYNLGQETVGLELAKQRRALVRTLDEPIDSAVGAGAASRLQRARQRGEHSARNIVRRVTEVLGRQQITGLKDAPGMQTAAERAATGALHLEALTNAAAMINDGRADGALSDSQVVGAVYTSVMDDRSCDSCIAADTGDVLSPEDALALGPPNPECDGQERCRCMLVWVLSSDPAAMQAATELG